MPYEAYAEILKQGNLVAFPTETVYGLGASAWSPSAIRSVFEIKGRPSDNPLIVHISSLAMLDGFTSKVSPVAKLLIRKFWPGPLTLVFGKKPEVLDAVTAGLQTVALRMPDHPVALSLIEQAGPLVAPSANKSGRPSPTRAEHVIADFGKRIPVIDGGECRIGLESTVLDVTGSKPVILRPGYITPANIEQVIGYRPLVESLDNIAKPKSPGMKYSHYAPEASVQWLNNDRQLSTENAMFLLHTMMASPASNNRIVHFRGDLERMARELYDWFRKADLDMMDYVFIESFDKVSAPNELIIALENRIDKAVGGKG